MGYDCGTTVAGESLAELLKSVQMHAIEHHNYTQEQAEAPETSPSGRVQSSNHLALAVSELPEKISAKARNRTNQSEALCPKGNWKAHRCEIEISGI